MYSANLVRRARRIRQEHKRRESNKDGEEDTLVTPSSSSLAFSPPRSPPHDSIYRQLLLGRDPGSVSATRHSHSVNATNIRPLPDHVLKILRDSHQRNPSRPPHPHLPNRPLLEHIPTRHIFSVIPAAFQNFLRDSGAFRFFADGLVTFSVPSLALFMPELLLEYMALSASHRYSYERISYGSHKMQVVDMFFPTDHKSSLQNNTPHTRGLVFFVHGGGWGSGLPWMYRLIASPFLEQHLAVAVVGYRTYPDSTSLDDQVQDLEEAAAAVATKYPYFSTFSQDNGRPTSSLYMEGDWVGNCIMGHSSGAHVGLIMMVERGRELRQQRQRLLAEKSKSLHFHSFVGLSGVYDVSHHFEYEAGRGVEELSPLKAVSGHDFRGGSPAWRLADMLTDLNENVQSLLPCKVLPTDIMLLHGIEDTTVPFTATAEACRILRQCGIPVDEVYLSRTNHLDTALQVMIGGRARESVLEWLNNLAARRVSESLPKQAPSKPKVVIASNL